MKRILLILNGPNPANTISFACYVAGFAKASLTGVFPVLLPYMEEPELKEVLGMPFVESIVRSNIEENEVAVERLRQQHDLFADTCTDRGIPFDFLGEKDPGIKEMLEESRLSDLIIIDSGDDVDHPFDDRRKKLVKALLANAECPVVIAPAIHEPIQEIVFCYDGSASSAFAMKQFTYLLPDLESIKATILRVSESDLIENTQLKRWLVSNFRHSEIITLQGSPEKEIFNYLRKKKNVLVIFGAYGRSMISRFFHQSKADLVIESLPFPVFITHF